MKLIKKKWLFVFAVLLVLIVALPSVISHTYTFPKSCNVDGSSSSTKVACNNAGIGANEDGTDAVIDSCTDGSSTGLMWVNNMFLNTSKAEIGSTVNVTCEICCYHAMNYYGIAYNNGSGWVQKTQGTCATGGTGACVAKENKTYILTVDNVPGTHTVRCMEAWSTDPNTCAGIYSPYGDSDDMNITVVKVHEINTDTTSQDLYISPVYVDVLNQYVGIGTSSPAGRFVVDESSQPTWKGKMAFSGSVLTLQEQNPSANNFPYIQWIDSSSNRAAYLGWGSRSSGYLDFALENNYRLAITGAAVGIRTVPQYELDVNGVIAAQNYLRLNASSGGDGLYMLGPGGGTAASLWASGGGGAQLSLSNGTENRVVLSPYSQKSYFLDPVGIGQASPTYNLEVNGASGVRISDPASAYESNLVFGTSGTWDSGIRTYSNSYAEMRIWHMNSAGKIILSVGYNGNQATPLPSDGIFLITGNRVGIGTTAPSSKLAVGGAGTSGNAVYGTGSTYGAYGNSTGAYGIVGAGGPGWGVYGYGTSYGLYGVGGTYGVRSDGGSASTFYGSGWPGLANYICKSGTQNNASYLGYCSSSKAFKNNITDLSLGLSDLLKLRPREFNWVPEKGGLHDLGFIAEEVDEINPLLTDHYENGSAGTVKYPQLTSLLTKAVQERQLEIDAIKQKNSAMIQALCTMNNTLDICRK